MQACLGTRVEPIATEVFYKPARVGSPAPYHQDNAYLHYEPAERDGGRHDPRKWLHTLCQRYTQAGGIRHTMRLAATCSARQMLEAPDPAQNPEVPVILRRGDPSIHHVLTAHHSGPNKTDKNRRGVVLDYKGGNAKVTEAAPMLDIWPMLGGSTDRLAQQRDCDFDQVSLNPELWERLLY